MLVALGVTGGIAAYKACEIVRGLDRAGVDVQVILTRNGSHFITPLTLQTLSRRPVLMDLFELGSEATVRHIDLTSGISALVVAPATADILAKFANGVADDFLSTFFLAVTAPVVAAPSMNTRMLRHPATMKNIETLRRRGVQMVDPESGWLAEGEEGAGRLADPDRIVEATLAAARRTTSLHGMKVVVTAGPTREPVDPVRFISNRSSGKMGYALATAAARRGAEVVLISGPVSCPPPFGVEVIPVETASQMREAVIQARTGADAVLMAAAVADHLPRAAGEKIKKSDGPLELILDRTPDILQELGDDRGDTMLVGFAAETENLIDNARDKLERKNLDFIVANDVSSPGVGMEADDNAVTILDRNGGIIEVGRDSKSRIAEAILDRVFDGRDQ